MRDPRVDPRPGDVLIEPRLYGGGIRIRREVDRVRDGVVSWVVGQFGYDIDLAGWRRMNAYADVVHAGEEEE